MDKHEYKLALQTHILVKLLLFSKNIGPMKITINENSHEIDAERGLW